MGIISARYQGTCAACGGGIKVGDQIDYTKGSPVRHAKCQRSTATPAEPAWQTEMKAAQAKLAEEQARGIVRLSGGSGYGCHGWVPNTIIHSSKDRIAKGGPEWLFVLEANKHYYREDGMSFGVGDEQGYIYSAKCRPATPEEAAPRIAELAASNARAGAAVELQAIFGDIVKTGERPDGRYAPDGAIVPLGEGQTIYGGGKWLVVESKWIWAIRNNGADGDSWDGNNIATGGAGAIGFRVPLSAALAERITRVAEIINGK